MSCIACGGNHTFEKCTKKSVQHLLGSIEFNLKVAVEDYNKTTKKYGLQDRAELVVSKITTSGHPLWKTKHAEKAAMRMLK